MKRAVILHGTDGTPEENWFPWLKAQFETEGYEVWVPQLPDCHVPNHNTYDDFLFSSDWDFTDNIVVGHSSGAVEVLNLLMDERCPHVRLGVMVSAWAKNDVPDTYKQNLVDVGLEAHQFENTFPAEGFDFARIKSNADKLAFVHSEDDPFCPLEQTEFLASTLNAPLMTIPNGKHLGSNFTEFPQLWDVIKENS